MAEVDLLSGSPDDGCQAFALNAFEHPKVSFLFVHVTARIAGGDSVSDWDVVERLSKRRIEGIALALRGERARLKGEIAESIAALEESIKTVPEYLPSRISLVRAYAKAGRKPAPLLARLRQPILETQSFIGSPPDWALLTKLFKAWPNVTLPESFPWADARAEARGLSKAFNWALRLLMGKTAAFILKVLAVLLLAGAIVLAVVEAREVYGAAGRNGEVPHGGLFGVLLRLSFGVALAGAAMWGSRRLADPDSAQAGREADAALAAICEREAATEAVAAEPGARNPYADLSPSELLDCYSNIDRSAQPVRFAQLLHAIRVRVGNA